MVLNSVRCLRQLLAIMEVNSQNSRKKRLTLLQIYTAHILTVLVKEEVMSAIMACLEDSFVKARGLTIIATKLICL